MINGNTDELNSILFAIPTDTKFPEKLIFLSKVFINSPPILSITPPNSILSNLLLLWLKSFN